MASNVIVVVFPSRNALTRALDHLTDLASVDIQRAAVVAKAQSGEIVVLDDDLSPYEGGFAGGALGAIITVLGVIQWGALALPSIGAVMAISTAALLGGLLGHVTGHVAARFFDFGYHNTQIESLANELQAGHPALVLELKDAADTLRHLRDELQGYHVESIDLLERLAQNPPDNTP